MEENNGGPPMREQGARAAVRNAGQPGEAPLRPLSTALPGLPRPPFSQCLRVQPSHTNVCRYADPQRDAHPGVCGPDLGARQHPRPPQRVCAGYGECDGRAQGSSGVSGGSRAGRGGPCSGPASCKRRQWRLRWECGPQQRRQPSQAGTGHGIKRPEPVAVQLQQGWPARPAPRGHPTVLWHPWEQPPPRRAKSLNSIQTS